MNLSHRHIIRCLLVISICFSFGVVDSSRKFKSTQMHPYNYRPKSGRGGTYGIFDHGKPIYIGRSNSNVRGRLNAHIGGYDDQAIGKALGGMSTAYKKKYLKVAVKPGPQHERETIQWAKGQGYRLYNKNNGK